MKLSICLFVFASSWKATNGFLPSQPRAFTAATTKTTTSSLNADVEHEKVSDYRKSMSVSRTGPDEIEVRTHDCISHTYISIWYYLPLQVMFIVFFVADFLTGYILSQFNLFSVEHRCDDEIRRKFTCQPRSH
jgi:hypothetical protein